MNTTASEEEYKNFQTKAQAAINEAIEKKQDSCIFQLSWINKEVAKAGKHPLLSYLVLSPDSQHSIGRRVEKILKELELATFVWKGYHLSYRGCDEGTYVMLKKDDPTKDKAPKIV